MSDATPPPLPARDKCLRLYRCMLRIRRFEEAAARALVRKKLRSLSGVDDVTAIRRLVGMLARKGYGSGLAFAVVKDELAGAGRDEPAGLDLPDD